MTQTELATQGILKIRWMLNDGAIALLDRAAIEATCNLLESFIEARQRGGKATSHAKTKANRRNASKPRKRKPRCLCKKMTADMARKHGHICPQPLTTKEQS